MELQACDVSGELLNIGISDLLLDNARPRTQIRPISFFFVVVPSLALNLTTFGVIPDKAILDSF